MTWKYKRIFRKWVKYIKDCSDSFWSIELPVFSNASLCIFFWMRAVFEKGIQGSTVSAVVWSPLEKKSISTWSGKGPRVLHLLPGTRYTVELLCTTGWMQPKRTHTMLLSSPWIDSEGLWQHAPESPKYVWLSLSMSKVNGHRLVTKYRGKNQEKEKIL